MSKRKPTSDEMWEIFEEICEWLKDSGCKIYRHWKSKTVSGSNGYFTPEPTPHIRIGLKGRSPHDSVRTLIHEGMHYCQWKEGFLGHRDDEGNMIYAKILDGKPVTPEEREIASCLVRLSEYDCEKRTGDLIKKWNLESIYPIEDVRRSAATYNRHIVWSIGDYHNEGSGVFLATYDQLSPQLWRGKNFNKWFSVKDVLSPISKEHKQIFDAALARTPKNKLRRFRSC